MYRLLLILLMLGPIASIQSQNLSGKWVGYFTTSSGNTYPYEITIQANGNTIRATTLTKFSYNSSAAAIANGYFTPQTKLVSIQESKFEYLQIAANAQACLMSNYLTYKNVNGRETLQGTYMSNNYSGSRDCGTGTVVLTKEMFFVKAKPIRKPKPINKQSNQKIIAKVTTKKDSTLVASSPIKASAELSQSALNPKMEFILDTIKTQEIIPVVKKEKLGYMPWVLISRKDKLIQTINTRSKKFSIELFDNGTIDNDSITVYDNKKMILDRMRLTYTPIQVTLEFSNDITEHELIIVAHNLGIVPPNTALLVVKDEVTKEEFFINTDFQNNAKIIVRYTPSLN